MLIGGAVRWKTHDQWHQTLPLSLRYRKALIVALDTRSWPWPLQECPSVLILSGNSYVLHYTACSASVAILTYGDWGIHHHRRQLHMLVVLLLLLLELNNCNDLQVFLLPICCPLTREGHQIMSFGHWLDKACVLMDRGPEPWSPSIPSPDTPCCSPDPRSSPLHTKRGMTEVQGGLVGHRSPDQHPHKTSWGGSGRGCPSMPQGMMVCRLESNKGKLHTPPTPPPFPHLEGINKCSVDGVSKQLQLNGLITKVVSYVGFRFKQQQQQQQQATWWPKGGRKSTF